jgi:hypothetical protein
VSATCGAAAYFDTVPQTPEAFEVDLAVGPETVCEPCDDPHTRPGGRHTAHHDGTTYSWEHGDLYVHDDPGRLLR